MLIFIHGHGTVNRTLQRKGRPAGRREPWNRDPVTKRQETLNVLRNGNKGEFGKAMKLGLIGLPQSGKSTVFDALTGARGEEGKGRSTRSDARIAMVTVFDERVDFLDKIYQPKKTIYAKIEYLLPSEIPGPSPSKSEGGLFNQVRPCDGLLHVVRNFSPPAGSPPTPEQDFRRFDEELVLSDLAAAEKRMEKIALDRKRGKKPQEKESFLVQSCRELLEKGEPLRHAPDLTSDPLLRGFTFLSAKPMLVIVNNDDEDETLPDFRLRPEGMELVVVRGRLE
ncbi:MAG: hypothetical protein GY849_20040, partial [Deltaproteobacteria bacterium]|nr:hypothetical protein [Deltaproteobacteria bacterium]